MLAPPGVTAATGGVEEPGAVVYEPTPSPRDPHLILSTRPAGRSPPARLCVFSTATSVVGVDEVPSWLQCGRKSSAVKTRPRRPRFYLHARSSPPAPVSCQTAVSPGRLRVRPPGTALTLALSGSPCCPMSLPSRPPWRSAPRQALETVYRGSPARTGRRRPARRPRLGPSRPRSGHRVGSEGRRVRAHSAYWARRRPSNEELASPSPEPMEDALSVSPSAGGTPGIYGSERLSMLAHTSRTAPCPGDPHFRRTAARRCGAGPAPSASSEGVLCAARSTPQESAKQSRL